MDDPRQSTDPPQPIGALLVKIWSDGEAAIIRQLLGSYGIPCQVVSDISHNVLPFSVDGLGEIRILVATAKLGVARELLAEHRRQGMRVLAGGKPPDRPCEEDGEAAGRGGGA